MAKREALAEGTRAMKEVSETIASTTYREARLTRLRTRKSPAFQEFQVGRDRTTE
jgi:hypothetical protein